ncbi:MAG: UDP-N-acetylmuramoyl-L-alanyl-D-glutamate--2,6-diaminopimelate ligase [Saprospiraceae bacterium]
MPTLHQLLQNVQVMDRSGDLTVEVGNIRFDSRQVRPGDVFVAVKGAQADGHEFIDIAIKNGAIAIVANTESKNSAFRIPHSVLVHDSAAALGIMAANFYDRPSEQLQLVGVTGTNGKTTTVTLLHQLFSRLGYRCGLIGTVENRVGDQVVPSTHTTPDAVRLQALLREMADAGCSHVFMEVSSHAVHQRRIAGAVFAGAAFTNLTHDHLDYHSTFADYRDAKKKLFDELPATAFALTNVDDRNGEFLLQNTAAAKYTYGLKKPADFKTKIIENSLNGLYLQLDGEAFHARLIGEFNAYNLTATYAVAMLLGKREHKLEVLTALSDLRGAEGRFEYVAHPTKPECIGIVDYAHTPDALEKVLETIQKLKKKSSKVFTVVGCGGDRDKTKRPIMAHTAARWSDQVVLTSDNPRTEDPAQILRDMEAGLQADDLRKSLTIENREQAIKAAVRLAQASDIVLVAGKGHEKYQDIQGVKHPFDDKATLLKYFES